LEAQIVNLVPTLAQNLSPTQRNALGLVGINVNGRLTIDISTHRLVWRVLTYQLDPAGDVDVVTKVVELYKQLLDPGVPILERLAIPGRIRNSLQTLVRRLDAYGEVQQNIISL
jgi:hypothetical protein